MDVRDLLEVGRELSARLLPVEGPIAQELGLRRVAEVVDHDVVAGAPPGVLVAAARADDVGDARVRLPPALVRGRERARSAGLRADERVSVADGPDALGVVRVRDVPDLVRGAVVAAKHVDLAVLRRQAVAIDRADHLRAAAFAVSDGDVEEGLGVRRVRDVDERGAVLLVLTRERIP